jgi:TRAP-type uncharacterized transport system fused permease subunit
MMMMMMMVISLVFTLNTTNSRSFGAYVSRQQTFATFFLLAHFLPFLLYPQKQRQQLKQQQRESFVFNMQNA